DEADEERARAGRGLRQREQVRELPVGEPVLAQDRLAMHRGHHRVAPAEGDERQRPEEDRQAGEGPAAHTRSPGPLARGPAHSPPSGPTTARTGTSGQRSRWTARKAAAASTTPAGWRISGVATFTPMASVMPAAAATAPRSAASSAGRCR